MSTSRDRILELFRQSDGFLSGEEICRELGISRSAVWKQVKLLREAGYGIEAVPSRGYRLTDIPDTLSPAEVTADLDTEIVGRQVLCFEQLDSTNTRARALAEEGADEGTVIIAEQQSAGKGRLGRYWLSPPGVNLYLSVILRPPIQPYDATQLTFVSAVAVAEAIESAGEFSPQLKWPNDVLLNGGKVAGLLNELNAESEQVHYLVLGIGVNLNMTAAQFPSDLRQPATSLQIEAGRPVTRCAFARELLRRLDARYREYLANGFGPVLAAWEERCNMMQQRVQVDYQDRRFTGLVTGLDANGALLLKLPGGAIERVLAGDVSLLEGE